MKANDILRLPEPLRDRLEKEQHRLKAHVAAVVDACKSGDAERFYHLTYPYDGYPDFWASAVRRIARSIPAVVRKFRKPFK